MRSAGPEPRASETRPGARRKMISEAATWAAPRSGKAGPADFEGRALRGWRFANVVCEPKPRPGVGRGRGEDMKGLRPLHASPNGKNRFVNGLNALRILFPKAFWVLTKSTPFEKMNFSFFRVASFSFVARQRALPFAGYARRIFNSPSLVGLTPSLLCHLR